MSENFWKYIDSIDIKIDENSYNTNENLIKKSAKNYVEKRLKSWISNENYEELLKNIKIILEKQNVEKINLQQVFEIKNELIIQETAKNIENEKKTQMVKNMIYSELNINWILEKNSDIKKFVKWVVDWLILDNIELVEELISKWIDEIVWILKNLLDPEIIKEIIKDFFSSLGDILEVFQKPYEWWYAMWWMWLWIFWKWIKWVKLANKVSDKKWNKAIDFDKIDTLELKWTYWLDTKKWLKPIEAKKKIEEFSSLIDIKYLTNNPQRIDNMLDIVESMCDYISKNSLDILKLSPKDLNDFRYVFSELRRNIDNLWKDNLLSQFKDDFIPLRWKMRETITILNPNLLPKN